MFFLGVTMKRLDDTFLCYDYRKIWEIPDDCYSWLCLSHREISVILASLRFTLWSSRWYDTDGRKLRELYPELTEEALTWAERLHEHIMSNCADGIQTGLEALADAVRALSITVNCGTTGGGGCFSEGGEPTITPGGNTVTGDISGGVEGEGEGDPPEGFASWEVYYLHKCRAANAIVDGFILQLNTFSIMTIISFLTVSASLVVIFGALPPLAIGLVIVWLVAMVETRHYLAYLADYISENRESFVCALYNSPTVADAIDAFLTNIDDGIEALALEAPSPSQIRQIVNALCDGGVFSKLYNAVFEVFYPDADCSGCAQGGEWTFAFNEIGSELGWSVLTPPSTNGEWNSMSEEFYASKTGVTDAILAITDTENRYTFNSADVKGSATGLQATRLQIDTSDDGITWTTASYKEYVTLLSGGVYVTQEFRGMDVVDKFVRVYIKKFETNPNVSLVYVKLFSE